MYSMKFNSFDINTYFDNRRHMITFAKLSWVSNGFEKLARQLDQASIIKKLPVLAVPKVCLILTYSLGEIRFDP